MTDLEALKIVLRAATTTELQHLVGSASSMIEVLKDLTEAVNQVGALVERCEKGSAIAKAFEVLRQNGQFEFVGDDIEGFRLWCEENGHDPDMFTDEQFIDAVWAVQEGTGVPDWLDQQASVVRSGYKQAIFDVLKDESVKL